MPTVKILTLCTNCGIHDYAYYPYGVRVKCTLGGHLATSDYAYDVRGGPFTDYRLVVTSGKPIDCLHCGVPALVVRQ